MHPPNPPWVRACTTRSFYKQSQANQRALRQSSKQLSSSSRRLELHSFQNDDYTPHAPPNLAYWIQDQTIPSTQGSETQVLWTVNHILSQTPIICLQMPTLIFSQDTPCSSRQPVSQPSALLGSPVPWN